MRKTFIFIFFLSLCFAMLDCSSSRVLNPHSDEYMPLSLGNKWFYGFKNSANVSSITEVVSIDTIEGKKYFHMKYSRPGTIKEHYNFQRVSNDTLFSLNYDKLRQQYFERIEAIFSLNYNDVAYIYLDTNIFNNNNKNQKNEFIVTDKSSIFDFDTLRSNDANEIERLPVMKKYSIKVINKDAEVIEFLINNGGIDTDFTIIYKKGVGLIKSKGSWGVETELLKSELN